MDQSLAGYTITGIGQDSHPFDMHTKKPLILGGVTINNHQGLSGNSDADVVTHAICNAISSISGINILGATSDRLCQQGITDSTVYVHKAMAELKMHTLVHLAISIEAKTPKLAPYIDRMKTSIAHMTNLQTGQVGITATSGEELTAFGQGKGIQAYVVATALVINSNSGPA